MISKYIALGYEPTTSDSNLRFIAFQKEGRPNVALFAQNRKDFLYYEIRFMRAKIHKEPRLASLDAKWQVDRPYIVNILI